MAAAEARTAWQRMANRCFVQEDAKRAPKLACCPSSAKLQSDYCSGDAVSGWEHPTSTFMHRYWNPTHSSLPPDLKWWLQVQPNFGHEKDHSCKQISASGDTSEDKTSESGIPSKLSDTLLDESYVDHDSNCACSFLGTPILVPAKLAKPEFESKVEGLKVAGNDAPYVPDCKSDMGHWCNDWEPVNQLTSSKLDSSSFSLDSPWHGGEKTEPWWRIADKDELATFVAKKSLEHFENCDLPRPQKVHISKDPISFSHGFINKGLLGSSCSRNAPGTVIDQVEYATGRSSSGSTHKKHVLSGLAGHTTCSSETTVSSENTTFGAIDFRERSYGSIESDPSKVQLLEALCHSQTRAREAEMAAEKAYNEKEHILKLFFRQASHLFAYKQWLRLLQLESLSLQLKFKDHQISSLLSDLPWAPLKGNHFGTAKWLEGKKKRKKHKCRICRYLLAFALGLGLVGAGLLLGWTLGCLLPV